MANNGWKLSKVPITGSTRSLLAKNGRKWVLANQIRPTKLSAAIVFRYTRFWPNKHQELPFLAITLIKTASPMVVVVVGLHIQRIVLATEETTVFQSLTQTLCIYHYH